MRLARFLITLALTIALVWALKVPQHVGGSSLPPLGDFFNPFTGFWRNAGAATLAAEAGNKQILNLPGLSAPVELVYDDVGVPHIFAQNLADAFMVQGYVTARDRLWQMDLMTRKAAGRLSEVFGPPTEKLNVLKADRLARRRGMVFAAERAVEVLSRDPETAAFVRAYTAGVNAWINQLTPVEYPVEYKLLNFSPEPWTELKTALMVENMAEDLSATEFDLAATVTREQLGPEGFDYLFPEWNPRQAPVVPDTGQWANLVPGGRFPAPGAELQSPATGDQIPAPSLRAPGTRYRAPGTGRRSPATGYRPPAAEDVTDPYHKGSNNWAVSGRRTAEGKPLLADDMHLGLTLPAIWYQVQLHTPDLNCYGVSLPGIPAIIVGFNNDVAWGVTNVSHDVADWYRVQWTDATRTAYLLDGQPRQAELRVEKIEIKGQPAVYDTVRYTVWGPVVHDYDPSHPLYDCAYRWMSHDAPHPHLIEGFIELARARNYDEFHEAIRHYDNPAQNFAFVDASGNIALHPQGRFPLRKPQQGRFIQDGSVSANAWAGFIPFEHMPGVLNPGSGFVQSANQHTTAPSYPYYYLGNFEDFRGRRIHDRLAAMGNRITIDSMKALQMDNYSQRAADALPLMLELLDRRQLDAEGRQLADELTAWRYTYDADLTAPALFDVWFDSLSMFTWDEFTAWKNQKKDIMYPESWRLIELLDRDSANIFFDRAGTSRRELAADVVNEAFRAMQQYFAAHPERRVRWAEYQPTNLYHLARLPGFSRLNIPTSGHRTAPNANKGSNGPSWRMIVQPGRPVRALGVYPGGQSGDPASPFYDNFVGAWARGDYFELLFLQSADEASDRIQQRITLQPASGQ